MSVEESEPHGRKDLSQRAGAGQELEYQRGVRPGYASWVAMCRPRATVVVWGLYYQEQAR